MISKFKSGVIFSQHTDTVVSVLEKMESNNIGSILVIQNEKAVGIVTERDVLKNWRHLGNPGFLGKPIAEVMSTPLVSVTPDKLSDAGQLMISKKIRHVPVIDHGGSILGIVSARDVLQSYVNHSLLDAVKIKKAADKKKVGVAPPLLPQTMHLLAPSIGLEVACRSLLPGNWILKSWMDPSALFDDKKFGQEVVATGVAFFIDIDGLKNHDWRALLKKFIMQLTNKSQPELFIAWSASMLNEHDVDALIKIAASARWSIFQKPLALGALAEEFRKLDERVAGHNSPLIANKTEGA